MSESVIGFVVESDSSLATAAGRMIFVADGATVALKPVRFRSTCAVNPPS
jgi:hypothetical protein